MKYSCEEQVRQLCEEITLKVNNMFLEKSKQEMMIVTKKENLSEPIQKKRNAFVLVSDSAEALSLTNLEKVLLMK